jgi:hypothetical protein
VLQSAPVTRRRRWRALLASLALAAGLSALPVASLPGHNPQQVAQAAASAGDVVFERVGSTSSDIFLRKASNGSEVNLTNEVVQHYPDEPNLGLIPNQRDCQQDMADRCQLGLSCPHRRLHGLPDTLQP